MMRYFIPKTGFQFFDVARAYGLGIMVYALSQIGDTIIKDGGFAYVIETSEIDLTNLSEISSYIPEKDNLYWDRVLKTSNKKSDLKSETIEFFRDSENIQELLSKHSSINSSIISMFAEPKKNRPSIPQSLELGAGKGIRVVVPSRFEEKGIGLTEQHRDQLYLAILGALNSSIYSQHRTGSTTYTYITYPLPEYVEIEYIVTKAITRELKGAMRNSHKAGVLPTLALIAVELGIAQHEFGDKPTYIPSLLFGVMARSPTAKDKPYSAGEFPMELINKISNTRPDILLFWRDILRSCNKKGYEDIAMALAKFIAEPTLENYYSYIRLHLRYKLKSDSAKFGVYDADSLLEVLKNVEVS